MFNFAASPQNLITSEMESMAASDSEYSSSCVVELMKYEEHDEWPISPTNLSPLDGLDSLEDYISRSCPMSYDMVSLDGGTMALQEMDAEFPFPIVSAGGIDDLMGMISKCSKEMEKSVIPRCPKPSFDDKMLKALHLCMQWSGRGTLAQVWVPMRSGGGEYVLSTIEQPFLHDGTLSGYREISKLYTFAAEQGTSSPLGLPGRVFTSKIPEWTSNVTYYNKAEYLRLHHAINQDVRGSIALPVFMDDLHERTCCAVLEIVTTEEKPNFDLEVENVCLALQAVELSSRRSPSLSLENLSSNQNAELAEIKDILYTICRAHRLPLALTWIPCSYTRNAVHDETIQGHVRGKSISPNEIPILCLEETTCYWNDARMKGFVHACTNHFLEEGKGLAGKALQSNEPFFYPDVKDIHVSEYPLVHHARKLGLRAAVAIRLRSTYTGVNDYVLEFFLPVNMERHEEQLLLVSNVLENIERICTSLSKVLDKDIVEEKKSDIRLLNDELLYSDREPTNLSGTTETSNNDPPKKMAVGFSRKVENKRDTSEKNISSSVLQQYFSGSLKDAAKSLGVCPTTLKRICRQHGIPRWPSRKLKKVDHSLKKIQSMLESVPGMEGGLTFDPTKGWVVAAFSMTGEEFGHRRNLSVTSESGLSKQSDTVVLNSATCEVIDVEREKGMKIHDESRLAALDTGRSCPASLNTVPWMTPSTAPNDSFLSRAGNSGWKTCSASAFVSGCSSSIIGGDEIDKIMIHESKQASSDMTDSSNVSESALMMNASSSSSGSLDEKSPLRREAGYGCGGTKITVKATLGEDTVRFKFEPDAGCSELYSEVAKRFELRTGEFQLRYLDDDEEWVLLVTDSDLVECLDVLEVLQTRAVKFGVDVATRNSGTSARFSASGY